MNDKQEVTMVVGSLDTLNSNGRIYQNGAEIKNVGITAGIPHTTVEHPSEPPEFNRISRGLNDLYTFNSLYGSMGSGMRIGVDFKEALGKLATQVDYDSYIITNEHLEEVCEKFFKCKPDPKTGKLSKEQVIGICRPWLYLSENTQAIPEDGYTVLELSSFIDRSTGSDTEAHLSMENEFVFKHGQFEYTKGDELAAKHRKLYKTTDRRISNYMGNPLRVILDSIPDHPMMNKDLIIMGTDLHMRSLNVPTMFTDMEGWGIKYRDELEDQPVTVRGNSRQKVIDNGKGVTWPEAKRRKGHR